MIKIDPALEMLQARLFYLDALPSELLLIWPELV